MEGVLFLLTWRSAQKACSDGCRNAAWPRHRADDVACLKALRSLLQNRAPYRLACRVLVSELEHTCQLGVIPSKGVVAQMLGFVALGINMQESRANVVEDQQAVVSEVRLDATIGYVQGCQS